MKQKRDKKIKGPDIQEFIDKLQAKGDTYK